MADIYRIGVSLALTNGVSQVLGVMARDLLGFRGEIGKSQESLNRLKGAMLGVGAVIAGSAILGGMVKLVEHGEELVHQQALLKEAGYSQIDVANATGAAWKAAADILGTKVSENLALVGDLRNRLGDLPKAMAALPQMAQIGVVLSAGTGQNPEKAGDQAARFLELRGSLVNPVTEKIDASQLSREARLVEAIAVSTKFKVGPEQLLAFQTTARAAGASLTDQGLKNLVPLIQAAKSPSNVGTQLSSLEQQLIGGVMTTAGAKFFERAGVLDYNKVHEGRGGHLTIDRNAVVQEDLLRADPATWIYTVLKSGLEKGFKDTTVDSQTKELMGSHLRNTVVGLLVEAIRSQAAFQKDAGLINAAEKTNQYQVAVSQDPAAKMKAFKDAWDNLLTSLGSPLVTPATDALVWAGKKVNQFAFLMSQYPDAVLTIEKFTAAFAGLLVLGGSLKVASVALGPFAAGLRALSGTLAGTQMAAAAATAAGLGGTLLGFAAGIAAVGAALVGLPPLLKWLLDDPNHHATNVGKGTRGAPVWAGGAPAAPSWWDSFAAGPSAAGKTGYSGKGQAPVQLNHTTIVNLDGKTIQRSVTSKIVNGLTSQAGPTGGDYRAVPTPPGAVGAGAQ